MPEINHFPDNLFDNEPILFIQESDQDSITDGLVSSKPDIVLVAYTSPSPENSIKAQQVTLHKLKDAINANGHNAHILYCNAVCFNQKVLSPVSSIKSLVFLGVKPFNLEIPPSKFYKRIKTEAFDIIVCHSIYQMDSEKTQAGGITMKMRLWTVLNESVQ